jgi:hypothetical protein
MATAVKRKLSSAPAGNLGIKIAAVATAGTAIHTAVGGTNDGTYHEIWLEAYNSDTIDRVLTLEIGGVTVPDNNIVTTIPARAGLFRVLDGHPLQNGATVAAFASAANVIVIFGFVNAITD